MGSVNLNQYAQTHRESTKEERHDLSKLDELIKEYQHENRNCAENISALKERLAMTQRRIQEFETVPPSDDTRTPKA